jgi:MazG family protein
MARLRAECPWDREQTHQSLVKNLIEETHELVEAISRLETDDVDWVGLAEVEDELGDVLLQVLFHSAIGNEIGAFDIDSVATVMSEKLVRRHPHVFGDVTATTADEVKSNWDAIKAAERGGEPDSLLDGVPQGMPALARASKIQNRAAKVGFDWESPRQVIDKVEEELEELERALAGDGGDGGEGEIEHEVGDLFFTLVNLARHLKVDPDVSLRRATQRFESRFRSMEESAELSSLSLDDLETLWSEAKRVDGDSRKS